jgi:diguanylate cyclase (GGDEF)-like protein
MQENKKHFGINKIVGCVYAAFVLIVSVVSLINSDAFSRSYLPEMTDYNSEWLDEYGNVYEIDDLNVKDFENSIILTKKLPYYIFDGDCICFESRNVNIKVSVGKRRVYDFNSIENITGKGYGVAFHAVGLSREDAGKTITMQIDRLVDRDLSGQIYRVYLGKPADYIRRFIYDRASLVVTSTLIIFFGLLLVVLWMGIPDKSRSPYNVLALGAAAFVVGVWCLINSNIVQLLSGHYYFWRIVGTLSIPMLGYPFVVFVNSLTKLNKSRYNVVSGFISILSLIAMVVLRYVADLDMMRSDGWFAAGGVVLDVSILAILLIENNIYCKKLEIPSGLQTFKVATCILLVMIIFDVIMWKYNTEMQDSYGAFMRVGIVIFIVIMILQFVKWWTNDQVAINRDRFINRSLQFAANSRNPIESIKLLLEYLGKELQAKRTYIFEMNENGGMSQTYEWFKDGLTPMEKEIETLPTDKEMEQLHQKIMSAAGNCFVINNADEVKELSPFLYDMMQKGNLSNAVFSPIKSGDTSIGFVGISDIPKDAISGVYEIMRILPYFMAQFINQRKEQDRIIYFSYHDSLSGAKNRIALKEFTEEKLDMSQTFGYVLCEIENLKEINTKLGHDIGDEMVRNTAQSLIEAFGDENVYRLSGETFVAFGFESDETYFDNDVQRAKRLLGEKECQATVAAVFCSNGATDIQVVIKYTFELLENEKTELDKGV